MVSIGRFVRMAGGGYPRDSRTDEYIWKYTEACEDCKIDEFTVILHFAIKAQSSFSILCRISEMCC